MKKVLILSLVLILFFTSCSQPAKDEAAKKEPVKKTVSAAPTEKPEESPDKTPEADPSDKAEEKTTEESEKYKLTTRSGEGVGEMPEIHQAAAVGDVEAMEKILKKNPKALKETFKNGITPLHMAAYFQSYKGAKFLIDKGADVNAKQDMGFTPLHFVFGRQFNVKMIEERLNMGKHKDVDKQIVELFLKKGADVNAKAKDGTTPLIMSLSGMYPHLAELLLKKGAKPNATDGFGRTPLLLAVSLRSESLTKALLDKGADVNVKESHGITPLMVAEDYGDEKIIKLLKKSGAKE